MPEMRCQGCRVWLEVSEYQITVPPHDVTKGDRSFRCPKGGTPPLETRGFRNPPPSMR